MSEQPGGMIDPEAGEVADKGESHFLFEYLACIIGIDGTVLRQILYGNILLIMLLRIIDHHLYGFMGGGQVSGDEYLCMVRGRR